MVASSRKTSAGGGDEEAAEEEKHRDGDGGREFDVEETSARWFTRTTSMEPARMPSRDGIYEDLFWGVTEGIEGAFSDMLRIPCSVGR